MIKDKLRILVQMGIVFFCTAAIGQPEACAAEHKRAVVMVFADRSGQRLGEYVTDVVTTELFKRGIYECIARVKLSVRVVENAAGEIVLAEEAEGTDNVLQVKPFIKKKAKMKTVAENMARKLVEKLSRHVLF